VRYCVIGRQAVDAYADPVVSLDLDLAVVAADLADLEPVLRDLFTVERYPHSLDISDRGSDLRVQIQLDPRYAAFVERAEERDVPGEHLPVASIDDVLAGTIWAASDPQRRASTRQKDLADIARLIEVRPSLGAHVPERDSRPPPLRGAPLDSFPRRWHRRR
jgi:hypothetical protein